MSALVIGCASAAPQVTVFGVSEAGRAVRAHDGHEYLVYLEVVNPSSMALMLSRLEYRVETTRGDVPALDGAAARGDRDGSEFISIELGRAIAAGTAAVVAVPIAPRAVAHIAGESAPQYVLNGRLFASSDRIEHSWPVVTEIPLPPDDLGADAQPRAPRARVAITLPPYGR